MFFFFKNNALFWVLNTACFPDDNWRRTQNFQFFVLPARVPSGHSKLKSFPGLRLLSLPVKSNTVRWLTNATSPAPSVRQRYAPWSPKYLSETLDGQVFRWKQIAHRLMGLLSSGLYFLERAPGEVQNGNVIVTQLFLDPSLLLFGKRSA